MSGSRPDPEASQYEADRKYVMDMIASLLLKYGDGRTQNTKQFLTTFVNSNITRTLPPSTPFSTYTTNLSALARFQDAVVQPPLLQRISKTISKVAASYPDPQIPAAKAPATFKRAWNGFLFVDVTHYSVCAPSWAGKGAGSGGGVVVKRVKVTSDLKRAQGEGEAGVMVVPKEGGKKKGAGKGARNKALMEELMLHKRSMSAEPPAIGNGLMEKMLKMGWLTVVPPGTDDFSVKIGRLVAQDMAPAEETSERAQALEQSALMLSALPTARLPLLHQPSLATTPTLLRIPKSLLRTSLPPYHQLSE